MNKNSVPHFVSVIAIFLGTIDLVRGFMHTVALPASPTTSTISGSKTASIGPWMKTAPHRLLRLPREGFLWLATPRPRSHRSTHSRKSPAENLHPSSRRCRIRPNRSGRICPRPSCRLRNPPPFIQPPLSRKPSTSISLQASESSPSDVRNRAFTPASLPKENLTYTESPTPILFTHSKSDGLGTSHAPSISPRCARPLRF